VTIGNFDGVHRGHAQIVARLKRQAKQIGGKAVVFTFDPHPVSLLRPELAPVRLTSTDRKAELLSQLGIDVVVVCPTDRKLLSLLPEEFFDQIIVDALGAKAIVEGPNFYFGRDRAGNIELLGRLCATSNLEFEVVQPIKANDEIGFVSSSLIRNEIATGNISLANEMLTRPHRIRGDVVHGAGRGATLGFPTANLEGIEVLIPKEGVYAGRAFHGGQDWPAAINVGASPTFGDQKKRIEVHLIGFNGSLYGDKLDVDVLSKLRDIREFDGPESLASQLRFDISAAEKAYRQKP
jgi:riboflavin kinase/FMN adenylyltransferase